MYTMKMHEKLLSINPFMLELSLKRDGIYEIFKNKFGMKKSTQ